MEFEGSILCFSESGGVAVVAGVAGAVRKWRCCSRRCCFPARWWRRLKMVALLQRERRGAVVLMVATMNGCE